MTRPLPDGGDGPGLGLAADFAFTREQTDRPIKFSFTGPFSLSRRIRNGAYADPADLVRALARWLNAAAARAGGSRRRPAADRRAVPGRLPRGGGPGDRGGQHRHRGRRRRPGRCTCATATGTPGRCGKATTTSCSPRSWPRRSISSCSSSPARAHDDLRLFQKYAWDRAVGLGVIDVKTAEVEAPDLVASRIRRALEFVPADRLVINPDCGLRHLPAEVARAKLRAMVAGGAAGPRGTQQPGGTHLTGRARGGTPGGASGRR